MPQHPYVHLISSLINDPDLVAYRTPVHVSFALYTVMSYTWPRSRIRFSISFSSIQHTQLPPQPNLTPAPPISTASISSSVHVILPNLFGNSLRSQTCPCAGSILPNSCPECPPMLPYVCEEAAEFEGDCDVEFLCPARGPCC